nr:MAG TPA: hypothetical protein [Caudoviricetes sp.]
MARLTIADFYSKEDVQVDSTIVESEQGGITIPETDDLLEKQEEKNIDLEVEVKDQIAELKDTEYHLGTSVEHISIMERFKERKSKYDKLALEHYGYNLSEASLEEEEKGIFSKAKDLLMKMINGIRSLFSKLWNFIKSTVGSAIAGVRKLGGIVFDTVTFKKFRASKKGGSSEGGDSAKDEGDKKEGDKDNKAEDKKEGGSKPAENTAKNVIAEVPKEASKADNPKEFWNQTAKDITLTSEAAMEVVGKDGKFINAKTMADDITKLTDFLVKKWGDFVTGMSNAKDADEGTRESLMQVQRELNTFENHVITGLYVGNDRVWNYVKHDTIKLAETFDEMATWLKSSEANLKHCSNVAEKVNAKIKPIIDKIEANIKRMDADPKGRMAVDKSKSALREFSGVLRACGNPVKTLNKQITLVKAVYNT